MCVRACMCVFVYSSINLYLGKHVASQICPLGHSLLTPPLDPWLRVCSRDGKVWQRRQNVDQVQRCSRKKVLNTDTWPSFLRREPADSKAVQLHLPSQQLLLTSAWGALRSTPRSSLLILKHQTLLSRKAPISEFPWLPAPPTCYWQICKLGFPNNQTSGKSPGTSDFPRTSYTKHLTSTPQTQILKV